MARKIYRGTIKNWTLHTLSVKKEKLDKMFPGKGATPFVVTGSIYGDPTHRLDDGNHTRTSLVVKIDRKSRKLETLNSLYDLAGTEDGDVLPNLGDAVFTVFY